MILTIENNCLLYPDTQAALKSVPVWAKPHVQRTMDICDLPAVLKKPGGSDNLVLRLFSGYSEIANRQIEIYRQAMSIFLVRR